MLNSNNQYRSRDRFSVAHELGHYYLPGHSDMEYYCTIKEILQYRSSNKKEHEANQFAAELLMPTLWLKNRIKASDISLSLIKKIAEECHTSLTATAIKIIKICRDRVGIAYSENGIIKWTAKSKSFSYELREGPRCFCLKKAKKIPPYLKKPAKWLKRSSRSFWPTIPTCFRATRSTPRIRGAGCWSRVKWALSLIHIFQVNGHANMKPHVQRWVNENGLLQTRWKLSCVLHYGQSPSRKAVGAVKKSFKSLIY